MKLLKTVILLLAVSIICCEKTPRDKLIGTWERADGKLQMAIFKDGSYFNYKGKHRWELTEKTPYQFTVFYNDTSTTRSLNFVDMDTLYLSDSKFFRIKYLENIEEYFPITVNSKWQYQASLEGIGTNKSYNATTRVTEKITVKNQDVFRVATITDDPGDIGNSVEYWWKDSHGLYRQSKLDSLDPTEIKISFPLVKNKAWDTKDDFGAGTCWFLGVTEVDLREKSYKDVLWLYREVLDKEGVKVKTVEYYARGIGLIKVTVNYGDMVRVKYFLSGYKI